MVYYHKAFIIKLTINNYFYLLCQSLTVNIKQILFSFLCNFTLMSTIPLNDLSKEEFPSYEAIKVDIIHYTAQ